MATKRLANLLWTSRIVSGFTDAELKSFAKIIGGLHREPDLVIADDMGRPYLYRWHVIKHNDEGNVYAHLQVSSDPSRPLHDHPWDNTSVILAGAYIEYIMQFPQTGRHERVERVKGNFVPRRATEAHRLVLPRSVPATLTLFTTGPKIQQWGFWHRGQKTLHSDWTRFENGQSLWTGPRVETNDGADDLTGSNATLYRNSRQVPYA